MSLHYGPKNGTSLQVAAGASTLLRLSGTWLGADGLYLQVHDAASVATVATGTLVKSFFLQGNFEYDFNLINEGISCLLGIVIAVSQNADPAAYTAYAGTATNLNLNCEIEPQQLVVPASLTQVGDLTTGLDSIQIWLNNAGPNKLYQVDVINGNGAVAFLCLSPSNNILNGLIPLFVIPLANVATVQTFRFGDDGWIPQGKGGVYASGIVGDAGGAENLGLFVGISQGNANGYFTTYNEKGTASCKIRAFYSTTQVQPIAILQPTAL